MQLKINGRITINTSDYVDKGIQLFLMALKGQGDKNMSCSACTSFLRDGPFLRTGFPILSRKAFGWVGGSAQSARKNYKQGKTRPLRNQFIFVKNAT